MLMSDLLSLNEEYEDLQVIITKEEDSADLEEVFVSNLWCSSL